MKRLCIAGLTLAGYTLAMISFVAVSWIGMIWAAVAFRGAPFALDAGHGAAGIFPGSLQWDPASWYARLYTRAYGEDRGWVVFLRRVFRRTGFSYPDPPAFPPHTHEEHTMVRLPPHSSYDCAECTMHRIALVEHRERRTAARTRTLAILRMPPYQQPLVAAGMPLSRCVAHYRVVFACIVYVLGVALPRASFRVGFAIAGAIIGGIATGCVLAYEFLVVRYGRSLARCMSAAAFGLAVYGLVALGERGWMVWKYEWKPAHQERIAYEDTLAAAEACAQVEKDAHMAARAVDEWRAEAALELASVAYITSWVAEIDANLHKELDWKVAALAKGEPTIRGQLYRIADVRNVCDSWEGDAPLTSWGGYGRKLVYGARTSHVSAWWGDAYRTLAEVITEDGARNAALMRVLATVPDLVSAEIETARHVCEPYVAAADSAQRAVDALFLTALFVEMDGMRSTPEAFMDYMTAACVEWGDHTWETRMVSNGGGYYGDSYGRRGSAPARWVYLRDEADGWGDDTAAHWPREACSALAKRCADVIAQAKANRAKDEAEAAERSALALRQEERRRATLRANLASWLGKHENDPPRALAVMRETCTWQRRYNDEMAWYGHEPFGRDDGVCQDIGKQFEGVLSTALDDEADARRDDEVIAIGASVAEFWRSNNAALTFWPFLAFLEFAAAVYTMRALRTRIGRPLVFLVEASIVGATMGIATIVACIVLPIRAIALGVLRTLGHTVAFLLAFGSDVKHGACRYIEVTRSE